jgi:hypothetical protein
LQRHNGHSHIEPISPYLPRPLSPPPLPSSVSSASSRASANKAKDESIYNELIDQLYGEKLRVTELTGKINELHRLEEEQRLKVKELAVERDRSALSRPLSFVSSSTSPLLSLYSIRDQLTEEMTAKTSLCQEQSIQLQVLSSSLSLSLSLSLCLSLFSQRRQNKTNRIRDLEKSLTERRGSEVDLKEKLEQAESKLSVTETERDSYVNPLIFPRPLCPAHLSLCLCPPSCSVVSNARHL